MKKFALLLSIAAPLCAQGIPGMLPSSQGTQAMQSMQQQAVAQAQASAMQASFSAQSMLLTAHNPSLTAMAAGFNSAVIGSAAGIHNQMGLAMLSGQIANYSSMLRAMPASNNFGAMNANFAMMHANNAAMLSAALAHDQMLRQVAMVRGHAMLHAAQTSTGSATSAQTPTPASDAAPVAPPPMMIRPTFGDPLKVAKPNFSVKEGKVKAGTQIRLKSDTHYSALYYTTDGWTPTTQSMRYSGPIAINQSTDLQVIAVGPNYMRSTVNHAKYTVDDAPSAEIPAVQVPADGTLRLGTPIRFATSGADVSSDEASVGDKLELELAQDIRLGDTVIAPKGTKVSALLTIVDSSHDGPGPGDLVFELQSMTIGDKKVPIAASETMEGETGAFSDNKTAVIKKGMSVTGFVAADTSFK